MILSCIRPDICTDLYLIDVSKIIIINCAHDMAHSLFSLVSNNRERQFPTTLYSRRSL